MGSTDFYFFNQCETHKIHRRYRKLPEELPESLRFAHLNPKVAALLANKERNQRPDNEDPFGDGMGKKSLLPDISSAFQNVRNQFDSAMSNDEDSQRYLFEEAKLSASQVLEQLSRFIYFYEDLDKCIPKSLEYHLMSGYVEFTSDVTVIPRDWQTQEMKEQYAAKQLQEANTDEELSDNDLGIARSRSRMGTSTERSASDFGGKSSTKKGSKPKLGIIEASEDGDVLKSDSRTGRRSESRMSATGSVIRNQLDVGSLSRVGSRRKGSSIGSHRSISSQSPNPFKSRDFFSMIAETPSEARFNTPSSTTITPSPGPAAFNKFKPSFNMPKSWKVKKATALANPLNYMQTINFQLSNKTFEDKGWIMVKGGQEEVDQNAILEHCVQRLQFTMKETAQLRQKDIDQGFDKSATVRYYGDTKKETLLKYRKSPVKTTPSPVLKGGKPRIPTINDERNEGKKLMQATHLDGSTVIYYPSGRPAIVYSASGFGRPGYYTIVYEDGLDSKVLAIFTPSGRGVCYYDNGVIRFLATERGGHLSELNGALIRKWKWPQSNVKITEPISFQLNNHMMFRCVTQSQITLVFSCQKEMARFNVGPAPEADEYKAVEDTDQLLTAFTFSSRAAKDLMRLFAPSKKSKKKSRRKERKERKEREAAEKAEAESHKQVTFAQRPTLATRFRRMSLATPVKAPVVEDVKAVKSFTKSFTMSQCVGQVTGISAVMKAFKMRKTIDAEDQTDEDENDTQEDTKEKSTNQKSWFEDKRKRVTPDLSKGRIKHSLGTLEEKRVQSAKSVTEESKSPRRSHATIPNKPSSSRDYQQVSNVIETEANKQPVSRSQHVLQSVKHDEIASRTAKSTTFPKSILKTSSTRGVNLNDKTGIVDSRAASKCHSAKGLSPLVYQDIANKRAQSAIAYNGQNASDKHRATSEQYTKEKQESPKSVRTVRKSMVHLRDNTIADDDANDADCEDQSDDSVDETEKLSVKKDTTDSNKAKDKESIPQVSDASKLPSAESGNDRDSGEIKTSSSEETNISKIKFLHESKKQSAKQLNKTEKSDIKVGENPLDINVHESKADNIDPNTAKLDNVKLHKTIPILITGSSEETKQTCELNMKTSLERKKSVEKRASLNKKISEGNEDEEAEDDFTEIKFPVPCIAKETTAEGGGSKWGRCGSRRRSTLMDTILQYRKEALAKKGIIVSSSSSEYDSDDSETDSSGSHTSKSQSTEIIKLLTDFPDRVTYELEADKELAKLQRKARNLVDDWMEHYRIAVGLTSPHIQTLNDKPTYSIGKRYIKSARVSDTQMILRRAIMGVPDDDVTPRKSRIPSAPLGGPNQDDNDEIKRPGTDTRTAVTTVTFDDSGEGGGDGTMSPTAMALLNRLTENAGRRSARSKASTSARSMSPSRQVTLTAMSERAPSALGTRSHCPLVIRQQILGYERPQCRCSRHHIPFIMDLEVDDFINTETPEGQLIVIMVVSSLFPGITKAEEMLNEIYGNQNRNRTRPCVQSRSDLFRVFKYDINSAAEMSDHTQPVLMTRHNVIPGMILIYCDGKLLFCDHIFNGYGNTRKDFKKQIMKSRHDSIQGYSLPKDFRFSPSKGRSGMRSAWGGEIGGAGVDKYSSSGTVVDSSLQPIHRPSSSSTPSSANSREIHMDTVKSTGRRSFLPHIDSHQIGAGSHVPQHEPIDDWLSASHSTNQPVKHALSLSNSTSTNSLTTSIPTSRSLTTSLG